MTGAPIELLPNPRNEASRNDLCVDNRQLLGLGLQPVKLEDGLLREVTEIAERYAHRCDAERIPARSLWVHPTPDGDARAPHEHAEGQAELLVTAEGARPERGRAAAAAR
jgi:UDP-sulfoquinovose synthase